MHKPGLKLFTSFSDNFKFCRTRFQIHSSQNIRKTYIRLSNVWHMFFYLSVNPVSHSCFGNRPRQAGRSVGWSVAIGTHCPISWSGRFSRINVPTFQLRVHQEDHKNTPASFTARCVSSARAYRVPDDDGMMRTDHASAKQKLFDFLFTFTRSVRRFEATGLGV